jgi:hypothetical protein
MQIDLIVIPNWAWRLCLHDPRGAAWPKSRRRREAQDA